MPIPIRLSFEMIERLENVAKKMGLDSRTAVIKMCVLSFLEDFEKNGVAGLPLDWRKIIHDLDGRSQRYNNINVIAQQSVVNGNMSIHHGLKVAAAPAKYGKRKRKKVEP